MKKKMETKVTPGDVLRVHSGQGPVGEPITIPEGTTSVTIVFRDSQNVSGRKGKRGRRSKGKANDE